MGYEKGYWQAVRDLTAYVEFLRRGGNKDSSVAVRLRGLAFPEGANSVTLDAIHVELAQPVQPTGGLTTRTTKSRHSHPARKRYRPSRVRETAAERRRRLAAEALKAA